MPASNPTPDFAPVFARLRAVLAAHVPPLVVVHDRPGDYYVNTTKLHPTNKQPLCFGMVHTGKNYVSFHLMPVYGHPRLLAGISPALMKRMQGKACFNFTAVDEKLFAELVDLTQRGFTVFQNAGLL